MLTFDSLPETEAQTKTDVFRFQSSKIKVGAVYYYLKTNIDGTHPEHVSLYVAARDKIESFKYHPKGERAGLVIAQMDWTNFSASRLESWQVFAGGKKQKFATMQYVDAAQAVEVSIPSTGKPNERTAIKHLPFHVYNFDLASLNFAFRHLVSPQRKFTIGIADPNFKEEGPLFLYKGEVDIVYKGEEKRQGVLCRKYAIDGPGLENRGGTLWVNKQGGYFEDIEIDLPDNPDWQTFKFRLTGRAQMSRKQWEQFMQAQFQE